MDKKITGVIKKQNKLQGSVNIQSATSGGPKIVYTNVTGVNGDFLQESFQVTLDMTYEQILKEIDAGNFVILKDSLSYASMIGGSPAALVPLVAVLNNSICFACSFYFAALNKTETLTYFVGTNYVNVQVYPAVIFD